MIESICSSRIRTLEKRKLNIYVLFRSPRVHINVSLEDRVDYILKEKRDNIVLVLQS